MNSLSTCIMIQRFYFCLLFCYSNFLEIFNLINLFYEPKNWDYDSLWSGAPRVELLIDMKIDCVYDDFCYSLNYRNQGNFRSRRTRIDVTKICGLTNVSGTWGVFSLIDPSTSNFKKAPFILVFHWHFVRHFVRCHFHITTKDRTYRWRSPIIHHSNGAS